ncbi:hypothetical protein L195_g052052 [Trifolium pratense]|uniref:Uncharacterized protein n=1 Tax=Trifolium pratense TaxID=57577 RepID=A0A2K3K327_TRIPR|nr:hypothetical protein L195_g052052 [Trifolium pratense]
MQEHDGVSAAEISIKDSDLDVLWSVARKFARMGGGGSGGL